MKLEDQVTYIKGTSFDDGKEYPFILNSAEVKYIFEAVCHYDLDLVMKMMQYIMTKCMIYFMLITLTD